MILWNFNYPVFFIFTFILILGWFLLWQIYLIQKNIFSFLFLIFSFLFLIINIFEIKWWYNNSIDNIEWWKVVFVLDVSKSMSVEDVVSDRNDLSRIEASKNIIKNYISSYANNNYWLMIFAWETQEVLPFTGDASIFNTVLFWVNNSNISKFWTNLNSVFMSLENYFVSDEDWWLVVIFSDLWDEEIKINEEQLKILKDKAIKILLVWVGSEKWWKIPDWSDFFWRKIYKTYNWQTVVSSLNISELKTLSSKYEIDNVIVDNINDFKKMEQKITKNIEKIDIEKHVSNRTNLTRLFVFISAIFFIIFLIFDYFKWKKT